MQLTRGRRSRAATACSLEPRARRSSHYNPADPDTAFTNAMRYDVGDIVVNLGQLGLRTFGVICNDGAAPGADNSCDLAVVRHARRAREPDAGPGVDSISPQVVNLQVQYGVAPANSQTVNEWVDATGGTWAAPTAANLRRIKAVRSRSSRAATSSATMVEPGSTLVLWDAGAARRERTHRRSTDDERRYRYKVLHRRRAADQRHLGGRMNPYRASTARAPRQSGHLAAWSCWSRW